MFFDDYENGVLIEPTYIPCESVDIFVRWTFLQSVRLEISFVLAPRATIPEYGLSRVPGCLGLRDELFRFQQIKFCLSLGFVDRNFLTKKSIKNRKHRSCAK